MRELVLIVPQDAHEKCAKTSRIIAKLRESNQEFELDNTAIQIPDHPVRSVYIIDQISG